MTPLMIAMTTDTTGVMSVMIRMMSHVIGMTCLIKKLTSIVIGIMTAPDCVAKHPPFAPA
jgi:hypothetical protein